MANMHAVEEQVASHEDLQFFGKVNASISHEIKNVFAVVDSQAGLLDDLCMLAAQGRPLDLAKTQSIAQCILQQVARCNDIVTGMNRFAHSVDAASADVNVPETLALITKLLHRAANGKLVTLEAAPCEPCTVHTHLYFFERLVHSVLSYGIEHAEQGAVIHVSNGAAQSAGGADAGKDCVSGAELKFWGFTLPEGEAEGKPESECDSSDVVALWNMLAARVGAEVELVRAAAGEGAVVVRVAG